MIAEAPGRTTRSTQPRTSGCGCGAKPGGTCTCGCESTCCDLPCLVRPNFFCGQMLTDADLTAFVEWTRQRLALHRYREGWGVICGLRVACASPTKDCNCNDVNQPSVWISSGYAVDCCGNDLVLCEDQRVDLGTALRQVDDPCASTAAGVWIPNPAPKPPVPAPAPAPPPPAAPAPAAEPALPEETSVCVDIVLSYGEELAQGQRAMFRGGCAGSTSCEYTRVREAPRLIARLAEDCTEMRVVADAGALRSLAGAKSRIEEIKQLIERSGNEILKHLRLNPTRLYCGLETHLDGLKGASALGAVKAAAPAAVEGSVEGGKGEGPVKPGEEQPDPVAELRRKLALWLYVEWLGAQSFCECANCSGDSGVPLARVVLGRTVQNGKTSFRVRYVDGSPRFRRGLAASCATKLLGFQDFTPYLGQILHEDGVLTQAGSPRAVTHIDDITKLVESQASVVRAVAMGAGATPVVVAGPYNEKRIVGFDLVNAPGT